MLKMMRNMAANSSEDKFKRIRLGNANFNSKVGSIDGGLEVSKVSTLCFFELFFAAKICFCLVCSDVGLYFGCMVYRQNYLCAGVLSQDIRLAFIFHVVA